MMAMQWVFTATLLCGRSENNMVTNRAVQQMGGGCWYRYHDVSFPDVHGAHMNIDHY